MRGAPLFVALAAGIAICTQPSHSAAQELPHLHYLSASWTEKDGLPGSGLWAIGQDADGYVWLGTNAGLVRFDGVRFVHWNLVEAGLPNSAATALYAARSGDLWVGFGGTGGVGRLRHGVFEYFGVVDGRAIGTVASIAEDSSGTLWIGGAAGAVTHRNGHWQRGEGLLRAPVYSVLPGPAQDLFMATSDGVVYVNEAGASSLLRPMRNGARGVVRDQEGRVWATSIHTAIEPVLPGPTATTSTHSDTPASEDVLVDRNGNVWVGTAGDGLWVAPAGLDPLRSLRRLDPSLISHQAIRAMMEDREGNLWIGTQNGLTRLSPAKLAWAPRALPPDDQPIRAVLAAVDGTVWAGGRETAYQLSPTGPDSVLARHRVREGITALHSAPDGSLWIGTPSGTLTRIFRGSTQSFALPEQVGEVSAIVSDAAGAIWVSDFVSGVYRLNGSRIEKMNLRPGHEREPAISMYADRRGRIWIGFTDGALAVYDGEASREFQDVARPDDVAPSRVYAMYEDSRGMFWVGTNTGLRMLKGEQLVPIELDYVRTGSYVVSVTEDGDGNLWLGCSQGLVRIGRDIIERVIDTPGVAVDYMLYDTSDGLPGRPAWLQGSPSVARTEGRLWFVTSNGLAAVDPTEWNRNRAAPPLRIEKITADTREFPPVDGLALAPNTAQLQIDFTAFSFAAPQKVRFRYRLDGFDRDWIDAGARRQAFYTNLPPGDYNFVVTAGFDDEWNETPAKWGFSVRPAYYQTTWFAATWVAVAALVVVGAFQYRSRRARDRFRVVLAERIRVSREIHDTLLQSLIGVTLQFDALDSELGPDNRLRHSFDALRKQLKQSIRDARHSIHNLRTPVPKVDLVTALQRIAHDVTTARRVSATVDLKGTPRPLPSQHEEELLRIAQEALINAVRHAKATSVRVELLYTASSVYLTITDNGRGFDRDVAELNAHDHWGLASMQERAEQIAANFSLSTRPGEGTMIQISLPTAIHSEAGAQP